MLFGKAKEKHEWTEAAQLLVNHLSEQAQKQRCEVAGHIFDGVDPDDLKIPANVTLVDEPGDKTLVVARFIP